MKLIEYNEFMEIHDSSLIYCMTDKAPLRAFAALREANHLLLARYLTLLRPLRLLRRLRYK